MGAPAKIQTRHFMGGVPGQRDGVVELVFDDRGLLAIDQQSGSFDDKSLEVHGQVRADHIAIGI